MCVCVIMLMSRDSDKDQKGLAKFIHKKDDFLGRVFYLLQVSNYCNYCIQRQINPFTSYSMSLLVERRRR